MTEAKNENTKCDPLEVVWLAIRENRVLLGAAIILTIVSGFAWYHNFHPLVPGVAIAVVDLYLLLVLFASAVRSDGENGNLNKKFYEHFWFELFPIRTAGLLMVFLFFLINVFSFAALYQAAGKGFMEGSGPEKKLERFESLYVSTVATVGYGSITPSQKQTKSLLMWEVASNLLLLVGIVSFLISRISGFGSGAKKLTGQEVEDAICAVMKDVTNADVDDEAKAKIKVVVKGLMPGA